MAPFFGKLRGNTGTGTQASTSSSVKKYVLPAPMTPLEKMLQDAGPLRNDGSDKFFGMENHPCADVRGIAILFFNVFTTLVAFRESVINYPRRSPIETLNESLAKNLHYPDPNAPMEDKQDAKQKATGNPSVKGGVVPPAQQPPKPEDKDSPEYKKKVAMHRLPILETRDNAMSYGMQESLFTSLKDIFEAIVATQERMGVIRPYSFLEVLRREHEMFRTAMHQDAHEFLNLLLNEVVANVEAEAERSLPPEIDQQSESDLSVDLDQHSSVTSCLRKFSEEEMLCERNKFHCDNCGGLQEAEKRMKIKRLPRILALHLKRFKYTEDLQRLQKLFHRVVYPYYLRLFNTTDDTEDPDRLYELYAVVVHIGGGPYHGHYVAIIKTEDRGWLLFDDEMVEPVDKNYVRNFLETALGWRARTCSSIKKQLLKPCKGNRKKKNATPSLPPLPHLPQTPVMPSSTNLNSKKSDIIFKKERAKEEKERKTAEKEKEKAQKQKRKELEAKLKEEIKRQDAELKTALELSKASKAEEDRRIATPRNGKENGQPGGTAGGLGRFKLGSRSLSYGILDSRDKEKGPKSSTEPPPIPVLPMSLPLPSAAADPKSPVAESNLSNNWPLKDEVYSNPPVDSTSRSQNENPKPRPNPSNFFNNMKIRPREVSNSINHTSRHTNSNHNHNHVRSYDINHDQNKKQTHNGNGHENNGNSVKHATPKRSRVQSTKEIVQRNIVWVLHITFALRFVAINHGHPCHM
ncbi:hypothetical protein HCAG_06054 [Histoplasma mississippiense (nom. inval.)]|uniref:hypothetical protein n=1 Tax=Ajellomyces capsulatus (strain NAm1 / WU24) TaxID=2059318 RepID=UPI000157CB85|nr:hypothetical protein HCAG_06054 [Histoplasma mississippiense (nom. inval.)]EDN10251.1 hypothetical protein HCAG_06054 [Histoplasma mississippiense (nom. inval.)]